MSEAIWKVAQSVGFDDYELRPMLEAFAAIAQQAQEPVGDRYFSYSTDMGFEEYPTRDEAIECANTQIKHYREDAIRDDEWPDEVDSVCWGVILGRSREIDTSNEDHESVDYKLYTTPPAPQPSPVDEREAFGYIHHYVYRDGTGCIVDSTWEADGCADEMPHPTHPDKWEWERSNPFYTCPAPQTKGQP